MTKQDFKVCRDFETEEEAIDVLACHTPEQAAREAADYYALDVGEECRVIVRDERGKLTYWLVGGARRYYAIEETCGIDPGERTGWCLYDPDARRVVRACTMPTNMFPTPEFLDDGTLIRRQVHYAVERPIGYGPTRPQLVECGITFGRLWERLCASNKNAEFMLRREVCTILSDATNGEVRVRNDSTAWAALCLLHGDGADRKAKIKKGQIVEPGGPLAGVRSHERAALAVAVACYIKKGGQFS